MEASSGGCTSKLLAELSQIAEHMNNYIKEIATESLWKQTISALR